MKKATLPGYVSHTWRGVVTICSPSSQLNLDSPHIVHMIVMSCNTIADKIWLILSHSTHDYHFHTRSDIPRTSVPHLNLDVIKSQTCLVMYFRHSFIQIPVCPLVLRSCLNSKLLSIIVPLLFSCSNYGINNFVQEIPLCFLLCLIVFLFLLFS